jgi:hypothetical protein
VTLTPVLSPSPPHDSFPTERDKYQAAVAKFKAVADQYASADYTQRLDQKVVRWQQSHETSDVFSVDMAERLLICDLRTATREPFAVLAGAQRVSICRATACTARAS